MTLWRRLLIVLAMAALSGPLLIGLAAASGHGHRWPDLLAQFAAPALFAAGGLTLLLLLIRTRWSLLGAGVTGLLLAVVWPEWFPPRGAAEPGAPVIRLYSANLWIHNTEVEQMRRSIEAADPDIIALIELGITPTRRLDELLAGYPHRIPGSPIYRRSGVVREIVASRWPIRPLRPEPRGVAASGGVVRTPLGPVTVVGVHLTRPWPFEVQWEQVRHADAVAAIRAEAEGPVVIAGDFNSVSDARIGRQIKAGTDLIPAPGFPGTWPSHAPSPLAITIDQVWRTPDLALVSRRLGEPTGSDHRPVVTEFTRARR